MEVNIKSIHGNWDLGYSLDKHTLYSTPTGYNEYGYMQFDTVRPPAGEALFQLKYRNDYSQIDIIADQFYSSLSRSFANADIIIPMPASKQRSIQPVYKIAEKLAQLMNKQYSDRLLVKTHQTPSMKDIHDPDEKMRILRESLQLNDLLPNSRHNILIIDDLFDTGSSLSAATELLRSYNKINRIYVMTVTRKR